MIRRHSPSLCSRRHRLSRQPFLSLSPLLLLLLLLLTLFLPLSPLLLQSLRLPKSLLQTLSRLSKHTEGRQDDAGRTPRYAAH